MKKYEKNIWEDRIVQYPNRYKDQNDNLLTLTQEPGEVAQVGTLIEAEKMNNIENGIEKNFDDEWETKEISDEELSNYTLVDGYLVNEKNKKLFNRYEKLIPVKLFESETGTTDTITLSKSINDFNSIEIFGLSSDNAVCYTKINKENYSNIAALYGFSTDGNLYAKIAYINLVDNQISFKSNRSWYKHQTNGSGGYNANANEIKITKVIGNYY